jgi:hypothetical protein
VEAAGDDRQESSLKDSARHADDAGMTVLDASHGRRVDAAGRCGLLAALALAVAACGSSSSSSSSPAASTKLAVSPAGAPYSYTVPSGFSVAHNITENQSVGSAAYETAVGVGKRDLLLVSVYPLKIDSSTLSDETIKQDLDALIAKSFNATLVGSGRQPVAGRNAFVYHFTQVPLSASEGTASSDIYFLFKGSNEISVNCQWKAKEQAVKDGCAALLASLRLA